MASANITAPGPPLAAAGKPGVSFRWLTPSLADIFLVAALALTFLTSGTGWGRLLEDGDTGLHTRIGDWILDHGRVPDTDPFSFSRPGAKWVASEWLTGVTFAALHRAWGLKG